jgi:tetratricopeptide (TPR) repeat protein
MSAIPGWRRRWLMAWGAALVFGAAAIGLAQLGWTRLPRPMPLEELSYYPSGAHLRTATLGHQELAADLAWMRAVQYYGEHRQSDNRYLRMAHVFDILTTLAPGFEPAYVFGAFALAQEGHDFPAAEALMLKGLDANPRSGQLAFQAGFLYYVKPGGRDLRHAAEYFEQASRQADAPPQAARFAAYARQNSGELQVALALWSDVIRTSHNAYLRQMAERQIRAIQAAIAAGDPHRAIRKLTTPTVVIVPRR